MGETGSCSYCGAVLCTHIFVTVIAGHELREIHSAHADTLICYTVVVFNLRHFRVECNYLFVCLTEARSAFASSH